MLLTLLLALQDPLAVRPDTIRPVHDALHYDVTLVLGDTSTHILGQVVAVCEKVVIISDGRIVVEDTLANLTREHRLDDAYKRAIAGGHREAVA